MKDRMKSVWVIEWTMQVADKISLSLLISSPQARTCEFVLRPYTSHRLHPKRISVVPLHGYRSPARTHGTDMRRSSYRPHVARESQHTPFRRATHHQTIITPHHTIPCHPHTGCYTARHGVLHSTRGRRPPSPCSLMCRVTSLVAA